MNEEQENGTEKSGRPPKEKRASRTLAVVSVAAVAVIALLLWFLIPRGNSGRPVPAPRTIASDQTSHQGTTPTPGESTVTISPEQVQRAGIKIEIIGERVSTEAMGQQTTGVIQPNSYRETPVFSLVGGIVRSVSPELGQSVRKGETVVVVSSNELADAQSRYLAATAELDEHHKHHARTEKLLAIGAASREGIGDGNQQIESRRVRSGKSATAASAPGFGSSARECPALYVTAQFRSEIAGPGFRHCDESHR